MSEASVCIPNIGPRERRKRMVFGSLLLVLGGAAAAGVLFSRTRWVWCAVLFLPFWMGGLGLFQATGHT